METENLFRLKIFVLLEDWILCMCLCRKETLHCTTRLSAIISSAFNCCSMPELTWP